MSCFLNQDESTTPPTVLTQYHGHSVETRHMEYISAMPEYPKTDARGYTYVIELPPEIRDHEKVAKLWASVSDLQSNYKPFT